ncbi:Hypothetical predicted protein [Mytilus galloprovincialis]|uniref:SUEL-type lectin domain-containing protein n=1 Tax=Mytilus galloprovincialis TaxID=29158 RepID=A0A8B6GYR7_MYTGA|nr:Hypothetical predicted protein [Mytilus galloprovincialis]
MRRFVLLLYFLFISRYLLTLGSSDHTSKSTTTRSGGYEGKTKTKVLCERETMNITCPNNSVIVFEDANFGRGRSDSQRCRQFWGFESIPCDNHEQTLKVLDDKCHEKQQCILPVTKAIFGNPCQGFTQYLYVNYHCKRKGNHDSITTSILTTLGYHH